MLSTRSASKVLPAEPSGKRAPSSGSVVSTMRRTAGAAQAGTPATTVGPGRPSPSPAAPEDRPDRFQRSSRPAQSSGLEARNRGVGSAGGSSQVAVSLTANTCPVCLAPAATACLRWSRPPGRPGRRSGSNVPGRIRKCAGNPGGLAARQPASGPRSRAELTNNSSRRVTGQERPYRARRQTVPPPAGPSGALRATTRSIAPSTPTGSRIGPPPWERPT